MVRLWRSIIGIIWGTILGAIAMSFVADIVGTSTLVNIVVYGIPILSGFLAGVMKDWWYDLWPIFVLPFLSLFLVAIILLIIICIALVHDNHLHLLWMIPLAGVFIPATEYIVVIFKK